MNFTNFGFKKFLNDQIVKLDFIEPTPVQQKAIPLLQKHHNLIVQAPTGTGKSHAFLLPLINNLDVKKSEEVQVVVVVPTQELGQQLFNNIRFLIEGTTFKVELHTKANNNKLNPASQPTVIIGTPQRLNYLYQSQERVLTKARALVVDEADMIVEQGFLQELDFLIKKMRDDLQVGFFSATINQELKNYLKKYIKNSFWLEIKTNSKNLVKHYLIEITNNSYWPALQMLVNNINPYLALIFVNNKNDIKDLKIKLESLNLGPIGELHSDLEPRTRSQIFKRLQQGEFRYVIASDLAARGLDISGVSHVISLGLPKNLDFYWHRSGRTGRNNNSGESYLLINDIRQKQFLKKLEKKGISFLSWRPNNKKIAAKKTKTFSKDKNQNKDLNQLIGSFSKAKIKPNYKKKQKQAVEKLKSQNRRKEIIASMRKNKKTRYKKRRQSIFD